jgi:hypothetical protein
MSLATRSSGQYMGKELRAVEVTHNRCGNLKISGNKAWSSILENHREFKLRDWQFSSQIKFAYIQLKICLTFLGLIRSLIFTAKLLMENHMLSRGMKKILLESLENL